MLVYFNAHYRIVYYPNLLPFIETVHLFTHKSTIITAPGANLTIDFISTFKSISFEMFIIQSTDRRLAYFLFLIDVKELFPRQTNTAFWTLIGGILCNKGIHLNSVGSCKVSSSFWQSKGPETCPWHCLRSCILPWWWIMYCLVSNYLSLIIQELYWSKI